MPKKKFKNSKCTKIRCGECPLSKTTISCFEIFENSESFGDAFEKLKRVVEQLEKDLEKDVEVNE